MMEVDMETCPYCGIKTEEPCDSLPSGLCEQAVNKVFGGWLNNLGDLNELS